ncbi:winged helix DNA-binding domain-containing protein [Antrihabitans sp. YC2-6]|uniref:winged helix DNA-binding domain-containing protein n=1 Tax=Antrihabitans sp. YC2-6 TaxID=2799498 RepID=UPI0018F3AA74|nr:winged helix DNA-binding domain-containing protein [Antrihabitans sp. YC2-6]MBJ8345520.1 AlkZ family DNA glycosylase [Antrihabitans sp. YC2-6]
MSALQRAQVLAYRFAVHGLAAPESDASTTLATGLQDYPPGRTALLALRLRTGSTDGSPTVLVHSVRAAMHLHDAAELPRLIAALRVDDAGAIPQQSMGPFGGELEASGVSFGAALDEVADAMRSAMGDLAFPTKGELSGAVSPKIDRRLAPWCEGCGADHVQDQLFRLATLQAGLVVDVDNHSPSQFRYRATEFEPADPTASRAELVDNFLTTFGPARPADLASWLGRTPSAAKHWWELVAENLQPVEIDGKEHWARADTLETVESAPAPTGVRLLPPYDPITELADRKLLVPDPAQRRKVWQAAANPGVVLVDGDIAGVWRQKRTRDRLTLRVEAFGKMSARQRRAAQSDADVIADQAGADNADLTFD